MKNFFLVPALMILTACGTIGIGSNQLVNIHNDSNELLSATGEMGIMKIQPNSSMTIQTSENISLNTKNNNCNSTVVQRQPNMPAIILNIVPGFLFGIVPTLVDALTGNLYKMPSSYTYSC